MSPKHRKLTTDNQYAVTRGGLSWLYFGTLGEALDEAFSLVDTSVVSEAEVIDTDSIDWHDALHRAIAYRIWRIGSDYLETPDS